MKFIQNSNANFILELVNTVIQMEFKLFSLIFRGYLTQTMVQDIPNVPGIYCAYVGVFFPDSYTVSLRQLLYIEEAVDLRQRISEHLESKTWDGILIPDSEVFCFSYAQFDPELTSEDHERIAHAFAYKFKPICDKGPRTSTAPEVRTQIECNGDIAYLESNFTTPF